MTKSPTILTRRSLFRAGAGLAVAATATPLLTPVSDQAEDARQAGAESLSHRFHASPGSTLNLLPVTQGRGPH